MDARLMFIDTGERLYWGYGREWPILVWKPAESRWMICNVSTPQDWDWGEPVTRREAERCYPGATKAPLPDGVAEVGTGLDDTEMYRYRPELFDDYDFSTTPRRSPAEIAERCGKEHARVMRAVADEKARRSK